MRLNNPFVILFICVSMAGGGIYASWLGGLAWETFVGAVMGADRFYRANPVQHPALVRPERVYELEGG